MTTKDKYGTYWSVINSVSTKASAPNREEEDGVTKQEKSNRSSKETN
jgi:hypothetical protein